MYKNTFFSAIVIICLFKDAVSEECGNVNAKSGSIQSPNYPGSYPTSLDCYYKITTPDGTVALLDIVDMKTEENYDIVNIYDGPSTDDKLLGKFSGVYSNKHINASSNQVLVHFTTDSTNVYKGFNITFDSIVVTCGGNYTGSSGSIQSPNYPADYTDNLNCDYALSTPEDTALTLEIIALDLDSCCDFIEIYDGPTEDYRLLGRYTGNSSDGEKLYAATNLALVYFHTDSSVEKTGFDISFTEREICEQEVSGSYGAVISPGYNVHPYPNDQNCYYKISTNEGTAVTLDIIDLSLEENDYVEIFDGPTTSSLLLGHYTGEKTNVYIFASTNEALIYFHTDSSEQGKGFYIYFEEREIDPSCPASAYHSDSGFITSPLYPANYPNDTDCYYSLTTSENTQITLSTIFLEIEESSNCSKDFVEIFDGPTPENSLARLCGSGPVNEIISSSNEVFIHFHSNSVIDDEGFNITYNTNPCPDQTSFKGDFGTIYSPGFPLFNYPNNADCKYLIETPIGSQVHVTVVYSNIEYSTDCSVDFVRIHDGYEQDDPLLGEFCGNQTMSEYQASTNEVLIEFHSDVYDNNRGFVITYVSTYHYEDDPYNMDKNLKELIDLINENPIL